MGRRKLDTLNADDLRQMREASCDKYLTRFGQSLCSADTPESLRGCCRAKMPIPPQKQKVVGNRMRINAQCSKLRRPGFQTCGMHVFLDLVFDSDGHPLPLTTGTQGKSA